MAISFTQTFSEDLYRDIVHSSACAYLIFEHGTCTYASPSYWPVVGYDPDEDLDTGATALSELLHPEDRDAILLAFADAVQRQDPEISMTYRGHRKDGSYALRNDVARLHYDSDGNHVKTYVAVREVPATDAAREEMLIRGHARLLGEMLHRTKNDLSMIRSILSLQAENSASPEARAALVAAEHRIDAVGRVYDHLHQSGRIRDTDIADMLGRLLDDLLSKTGLKCVVVTTGLSPGLVVSVRLSTSVAIILNEIVTNAAKYADPTGTDGELAITASTDHAQRELALRIRDSGPGFPQHVVDGSHLGFGLEMVVALVSQHNGTVHFSVDNGAVIDITIPLDPAY